MAEVLLRLKQVTNAFGPVQSLSGVDLEVRPAEVLGLVGDNGAGKSTLVKIIAGVLRPDGGHLEWAGRPIDPARHDVAGARALGIETVHQDRAIGEKQPLWRNVFAGRHLANKWGFIRVGQEKRLSLRVLNELVGLAGAGLAPEARAGVLSGGERQGLAIGRAMHFQARLIILDEPTTALSLREVERVMGFVGRLKAEGRACIYVSHTMAHVHAAADRFVVMNRGRIAAVGDKSDTGLDRLCELVQCGGRPEMPA